MNRLLLFCALVTSCAVACNLTVGECYPVGQGPGSSGGLGASVTGGGTGADGDVPGSQPQGLMSQADCNAMSQNSGSTKVSGTPPPGGSGSGGTGGAGGTVCSSGAGTGGSADSSDGGASPTAGCTSRYDECQNWFVTCQSKGYPCTRKINPGSTLCDYCLTVCLKEDPYKYKDCYTCGFKD